MNSGEASVGFGGRWFYWWADHTWVHVVVLVLMSALTVIGYVRPSLVRNLFVDAPNSVRRAESLRAPRPIGNAEPNVEAFQVSGGDCLLVATSPSFFTTPGLTAIRDVVKELEDLPQVASILWLDNIPGLNLFGLPGELLPRSNASSRQMQAGRERTLNNPLAVGQLISPDGQTMLLHIRLDWFFATSNEACTTEIRERAVVAAARTPGADIRFHLTGPVPLHLMTANSHLNESLRYQVIGYSIMVISALILFRGLQAVIIVALAPAVGVFWTMGSLRFFNLQDNPFNDIIVPVLISLVGLTDAVHLMVEIRHQRGSGLDVADAARRAVSRVGLACFLTSLTTAIGFVSLAWAHHEIVRQFGWCCVLGVALTFVSVLTVVPLGCRSPLGRRLHVGLGKGLIDGQIRRIEPMVAWVLRHDRLVSWFTILITALMSVMTLQLEPDEKRYSGLSEAGEAAQALRHLDRSLGGLEFGFVYIDWLEGATSGELLKVLLEVDQILSQEPLIGHPLGLHELLAALPGQGPADERMTLLELLPASLKRAFYAPERRRATVQFRVQDLGIARYGPVFDRLESAFERIKVEHPQFALSLDGDAVWRFRHVYRIVMDLATSLGTASFIIWIVMTVAFRSLRLGLISVVPNLFPLAATGALLYLSGQYLELPTVCMFTICVGIAVDDTIHFLTRFQEELAEGGERKAIILRASTSVGSAMLMTTIVLVAGMLTAAFGDAQDARLFGTMGAVTLATALFADLFLLPALLSQFARVPSQPSHG